MPTIIFSSVISGEVKLRIPNCTIRSNGTIWGCGDTIPVILTSGLPNSDDLKKKYMPLVEAKRFSEIDDAHFARLGVTRDTLVELEEDYNRRPLHPAVAARQAEQKELEDNRIVVHLSTRGWGDYSSVEWRGDRRRPVKEIVAKCQKLLKEGHDVDQPEQPDELVANKVRVAIQASLERDSRRKIEEDELRNLEVPESAVKAYQACSGDPENFEDDIDDPRYWQVRRFGRAIEFQGLASGATLKKVANELRDSAREETSEV